MSSPHRDPSETSDPEPVEDTATNPHSLSRAVLARKSEYVRPHRIRIKIGSWNVAGFPGTDKDLASWFVDGQGIEPQFNARLARLSLSEDSNIAEILAGRSVTPKPGAEAEAGSGAQEGHVDVPDESAERKGEDAEPGVRLVGGDKIGLYVLGLQEVVNLNVIQQSIYSDPGTIAKWQDALETALPKGYTLVASQQLVGLLLLIYASPEVAETISHESTVSIGTGVLRYWGNKGAIASRLLLGETTRLVFINSHLASGHDQASLDRRCWDYHKIMAQTKFTPINSGDATDNEGDAIGDEDFAFWLGDLNFRLDGLPGNDIRHLLTLHTRGEYDISKKRAGELLNEEGVVVLRNRDDGDDDTNTPRMISRENSFDEASNDDETELPDPDDFAPDPHDDPASLQATLDSLIPHDQLKRMMKQRKAFHEGWREGTIGFLPTYKYDIGTVGLFDSSEKMRAPSWCDRILYRTRTDITQYEKKCKGEMEAKERDEDMKRRGIDQAAADESTLFDYDLSNDSSSDNPASGDTPYDYDEYNETEDATGEEVVTKEGYVDRISLDIYTSHQRIMSSDHKPVAALFTLDYDAVVPELKARVHAEVAWELDRAENEGRPGITVVVEGKDSIDAANKNVGDGSEGVNFGEIGFLRKATRYLTIANTGRVPATFSFVEKPHVAGDATEYPRWLEFKFTASLPINDDRTRSDALGDEITLEPGETVNALLCAYVRDLAHVRALNEQTAQLDDVLILGVTDGRDHFIPVRAAWIPTCFGRSLEELIRVPRDGGIRGLVAQQQIGGSIPYSLEVHKSSPGELFKLTEALESLAERVVADENMLEEYKVPREEPGWPFDRQSWKTAHSDNHDEIRLAVVEALEEGRPVMDAIEVDTPSLKRLEIVSEVLLLFLTSMPDGIITAPLWAKIESALPSLGDGRAPAEPEEIKSTILDILATAPYYNISFVFLTSMLMRVANELIPLSKEELEALNTRKAELSFGRRSLSFRRNTASLVNELAIQRRVFWEKKVAEIFSTAICRSSSPANAREKKATEDKMKSVIELFVRQEVPR